MREIRSYGSVRGVQSNLYPYRDLASFARAGFFLLSVSEICVPGHEVFFLALAQRAWAALRALSRRCSGVRLRERALPPLLPNGGWPGQASGHRYSRGCPDVRRTNQRGVV